ncbi:MAG: carotenoid 1,2-hydratase [Hyphomicrobiaceae bacterium]|nr:carotenoid 1,2-hydratase [Hyphomicrobiaceae bacterium]
MAVPDGGYAWWYLDALSADGEYGITIIAFIGSVFSPYYASKRRSVPGGQANPLAHCALNVALYGRGGHRWAMTERDGTRTVNKRGDGHVSRTRTEFTVGPSAVSFDGTAYTVRIDETTVPFPNPIASRISGTVRLYPSAIVDGDFELDAAGVHRWRPIAPCARVEVDLPRPGLRWSGSGYLDMNSGGAALERDFQDWCWSRATLSDGSTVILYDVTRRQSAPDAPRDLAVAIRVGANGDVEDVPLPPPAVLQPTLWGIARETRADHDGQSVWRGMGPGRGATVLATFEDGPFYSRSLLSTRLLGEQVPAVHESLSLDRFGSRWVQFLLPFKMPRR